MLKIVVFCNSDEKTGFGHLSRCLSLTRTLAEIKQLSANFCGSYNDLAKQRINGYGFELSDPDTFDRTELDQCDLVLVDRYDLTEEIVNELIAKNSNVVFIDDFNLLQYPEALAVINHRFNAELLFSYSSKNSFLGIENYIIKPEFARIRQARKGKQQNSINTIALFSSGIDGTNSFETEILQQIDSAFTGKKIIVLNSDKIYSSARNTIEGVGFVSELEQVFTDLDLLICGGGGIKYESSYCQIPTVVSSITPEQQIDTNILAELGVVIDANASDFQWSRVEQELQNGSIHSKMNDLYSDNSTFNLASKLIELVEH